MLLIRTVLLLLFLALPAWCEPPEDPSKMQDLAIDFKRECGERPTEQMILSKMIHLKIPAESWPRMLSNGNEGGGRLMSYMTRTMLRYLENAYGVKGLSEAGSAGQISYVEQQLDQLAPKFSFTYVYEGPNEEAAWANGMQCYSYLTYKLEGTYGLWRSKSGVCHITLKIDPKVTEPSCTSDGQNYKIVGPCSVITRPDVWETKVNSVLERHNG